ncbi:unnamed protein product [Boreogadus saida]
MSICQPPVHHAASSPGYALTTGWQLLPSHGTPTPPQAPAGVPLHPSDPYMPGAARSPGYALTNMAASGPVYTLPNMAAGGPMYADINMAASGHGQQGTNLINSWAGLIGPGTVVRVRYSPAQSRATARVSTAYSTLTASQNPNRGVLRDEYGSIWLSLETRPMPHLCRLNRPAPAGGNAP